MSDLIALRTRFGDRANKLVTNVSEEFPWIIDEVLDTFWRRVKPTDDEGRLYAVLMDVMVQTIRRKGLWQDYLTFAGAESEARRLEFGIV